VRASYVIQEIRAVSVSEIEIRHCLWLCVYFALSAEAMPVSSALFLVLLISTPPE